MIRIILYILSFFLFSISTVTGQSIVGKVLDAKSKQPIPYATVTYDANKGVITNDEGSFALFQDGVDNKRLTIASLGYKTRELTLEQIKQGPILLEEESINLDEIFLTNKNLLAKEIIERVMEQVSSNYNFELTQKRFFFRKSNVNTIRQFDLIVDKSTIPELNQILMDSITNSVPKINDSYKEILGDFYGNYDKQKVNIIKAANLFDPKGSGSLTELTDRLESIFEKNVKKDSYFKVKSGIIGFKIDPDDIKEDLEEDKKAEAEAIQQTLEEREKAIEESRNDLKSSTDENIRSLMTTVFWKEGITLNLFEKSRKYNFNIEGYTSIDNELAYIISFEPKGSADFEGHIYVNTVDFGIFRIDYNNVKPLKRFRLFGFSQADDVYKGKMIFSKDTNGLYNPVYLEKEVGESFGLDRLLTLIEKNKNVIGRRKQNELDLDIKIKDSQIDKYQLVIFENKDLADSDYDNLNPETEFESETFKKYNPEFWKGYTIIEPNAAIKSFVSSETD